MKTLPILLALLFCFGCTETSDKISQINAEARQDWREEKLASTDLEFQNSQKIPGSDYYMYTIRSYKEQKKRTISSAYSGSAYTSRTWNLAFYNQKTKKTHLLLEDQVPIIEYHTSTAELQKLTEPHTNPLSLVKVKEDYLFYEMRMEDFNENGYFDLEDPKALYVSQLDGSELKRVSPAGYDLLSWKFLDQEKTELELRLSEDIDGDKRFTGEREKIIILPFNIPNGKEIELFPKEFRDQLKERYINSFPESTK